MLMLARDFEARYRKTQFFVTNFASQEADFARFNHKKKREINSDEMKLYFKYGGPAGVSKLYKTAGT